MTQDPIVLHIVLAIDIYYHDSSVIAHLIRIMYPVIPSATLIRLIHEPEIQQAKVAWSRSFCKSGKIPMWVMSLLLLCTITLVTIAFMGRTLKSMALEMESVFKLWQKRKWAISKSKHIILAGNWHDLSYRIHHIWCCCSLINPTYNHVILSIIKM